jgi:hypothetical protein
MSWPYLPNQCPGCWYFAKLDQRRSDDAGYAIPGICAHPLISMELFVTREGLAGRMGHCELFVSAPRSVSKPSS